MQALCFTTCLVSGPTQAASVPVLKSDAGMVTLVGRGGGGGGWGRGGGGGGRHAYGGGGGKRYYGGGGDRKRYAYKGGKRYGYEGRYRRYGSYGWYGAPFLAYGAYAGSCGWMYRNAVATGDPYWWNRYYECTGYY